MGLEVGKGYISISSSLLNSLYVFCLASLYILPELWVGVRRLSLRSDARRSRYEPAQQKWERYESRHRAKPEGRSA